MGYASRRLPHGLSFSISPPRSEIQPPTRSRNGVTASSAISGVIRTINSYGRGLVSAMELPCTLPTRRRPATAPLVSDLLDRVPRLPRTAPHVAGPTHAPAVPHNSACPIGCRPGGYNTVGIITPG